MNDPERDNYDDDFTKGPRFPFAIYVASRIWAAAGLAISGFGAKYVIVDIYNRILHPENIVMCLFWFVAGQMVAVSGMKYANGFPKTTSLLFIGSVVITVLCGVALVAKLLNFFQPIGIGLKRWKPFEYDLIGLIGITTLSYFTAVLARNGGAEYRVWKAHQPKNKKLTIEKPVEIP